MLLSDSNKPYVWLKGGPEKRSIIMFHMPPGIENLEDQIICNSRMKRYKSNHFISFGGKISKNSTQRTYSTTPICPLDLRSMVLCWCPYILNNIWPFMRGGHWLYACLSAWEHLYFWYLYFTRCWVYSTCYQHNEFITMVFRRAVYEKRSGSVWWRCKKIWQNYKSARCKFVILQLLLCMRNREKQINMWPRIGKFPLFFKIYIKKREEVSFIISLSSFSREYYVGKSFHLSLHFWGKGTL